MEYKYKLPDAFVDTAAQFEEFVNGGAQATIRLKDGRIFEQALISNSQAIIALRGYTQLPFCVTEIAVIYQTAADKNPEHRGDWYFWDTWK